MGYCYIYICFASCMIAYLWSFKSEIRTELLCVCIQAVMPPRLLPFLSLMKSPLHLHLIQIPYVPSEQDE